MERAIKIPGRSMFLLVLGLLSIWFLFIERAILTPFILAAIFAYILNPLVTFFSRKTKMDRVVFIILLYVFLFSAIATGGTIIVKQFLFEVEDLTGEIQFLLQNADSQVAVLPEWAQGIARDGLVSLKETFTLERFSAWPVFSGAATRVFTVLTFFFASFFFLKDGNKFINQLLLLLPGKYKVETEILLNKINAVLANYLRAQLFLVFLMGLLGFVIFSLLGVRFSLILAIVIGLAEIVPIIGPIIAGLTIVLVSVFDGASQFSLPPLSDGLIVLAAYTILNQIENYLIVPSLMGRVTKLHPLLVFFSVLAGGHLFGILGFILALPIAASLRVILEFGLEKVSEERK